MNGGIVHCIDCVHFDLRRNGPMARLGYGHCDLDPVGRFQSATFDRTCKHFVAADPEAAARRRQWLEARAVSNFESPSWEKPRDFS